MYLAGDEAQKEQGGRNEHIRIRERTFWLSGFAVMNTLGTSLAHMYNLRKICTTNMTTKVEKPVALAKKARQQLKIEKDTDFKVSNT